MSVLERDYIAIAEASGLELTEENLWIVRRTHKIFRGMGFSREEATRRMLKQGELGRKLLDS